MLIDVEDEQGGDATRLTPQQWSKVCSRGTGVGADGVLFFSRNPYKMFYINADGHEADMCGNGLRAICDYISRNEPNVLWPIKVDTKNHQYNADLRENSIWIEMADLSDAGKYQIDHLLKENEGAHFVNSGVPHAVFKAKNIDSLDLESIAPAIRIWNGFPNGANVDLFEELAPGKLKMRVFERGVEGETLSSGTGTTAVALAYREIDSFKGDVEINTKGGLMKVRYQQSIPWLSGPVTAVYQASLDESFLKSI